MGGRGVCLAIERPQRAVLLARWAVRASAGRAGFRRGRCEVRRQGRDRVGARVSAAVRGRPSRGGRGPGRSRSRMGAMIVKGPPPGALCEVDSDYPLEPLGPTAAGSRGGRGCLGLRGGGRVRLDGGARDDRGSSLALGASTPWTRLRCNRGGGTSAASRCMHPRGSMTIWGSRRGRGF
jgi:hypothetical protein